MIFIPTVQSVLSSTSHQALFLFSFVSVFHLVPQSLSSYSPPASGLIHVPLGVNTTGLLVDPSNHNTCSCGQGTTGTEGPSQLSHVTRGHWSLLNL